MIYKSKEFKRNNFNKLIFNIVILIYFTGLCAGCTFATKCADNLAFIKEVCDVQSFIFRSETPFLKAYSNQIIHSLSLISIILLFKYSGVLKSMTVVVPFILAVHNSCVNTVLLADNNLSIYQLLFHYTLKSSATAIVIILYVYTITKEILAGREDIKRDFKKLCIYCITLFFIFLIDYLIKILIYPR